MGYTNSLPYQQIEIKSVCDNAISVVTTVAGSYTLKKILIPDFKLPISYAYLDLHIPGRLNTNVGNNMLIQSGSFGIADTGFAHYYSAGSIQNTWCWTPAATFIGSDFVIPGTTNLQSSVNVNNYEWYVYLTDWRSDGDQLQLYNPYAVMRLYFAV